MHDCLSISQWLLSTTRVLGVVLELEVISGRLFLNEYIRTVIASFPDLPAHLQTCISYTHDFLLSTVKRDKKLITHIMFAGEREGLGMRLCIHAITSYLSTSKVTCIKINWY